MSTISSQVHGSVVFRQIKKTEGLDTTGAKEVAAGDHDDDVKVAEVRQHDRTAQRNFWLVLWTVPVLLVLFWLPVQEEFELQGGASRARLEDRVSVLAKQPIDFVVHASSHQRWSYQYKKPFKPATATTGVLSSSQLPCVRLFGQNESLNTDQNLRKILPRIRYIRIIGERNSGTRILHVDLQKALRNVTIDSGVTRWGYWFQDAALLNSIEHKPDETLVIHVVLDPYDWFARMLANPIHAPFHRKPVAEAPNANWTSQTFFKRAWTCPRPDWDEIRPAQGHCQYRFAYDAVIPCMAGKNTGAKANKNYPVYEMHPTKLTPFPTVVHLRTAKLRNFLNVTTWMPHVVHVRSRDVAGLNGVNAFVSALLDRYRLSVACEVHKRDSPKALPVSHTTNSGVELLWADNPPEPLTSWQTKFITCNLDWDVEQQVGFTPREDIHTSCPHGFVGHTAGKSKEPVAPEKNILFRFMDGISNLGRRRIKTTKNK